MNWGWKITLVYVAFAAMMVSFVVRARHNRIDLVTKDYYEQELKYDDQMAAIRNAQSLDGTCTAHISDGMLVVQLPGYFSTVPTVVKAHLYCPSDSRNDRHWQWLNDVLNSYPLNEVAGGYYLLQLTCSAGGKNYFFEQPVTVP